jgi:hypothetical protein
MIESKCAYIVLLQLPEEQVYYLGSRYRDMSDVPGTKNILIKNVPGHLLDVLHKIFDVIPTSSINSLKIT